MKKKELEMELQKVRPFVRPRADLEQYPTSATIAAEMVFTAYARGDIEGRTVLDLGCGTGVLSVGAALMGATRVIGVELDEGALAIARDNALAAGVEIELMKGDVGCFQGRVDTVLQNPPFGSQNRNADRPFLDKAMAVADVVYSLHMSETIGFLAQYASERGFVIEFQKRFKFDIPHTFAFHRKSRKSFDVSFLCFRRCGEPL
ncbi:MAG: methyltransferase [Methanomassiliicoccales archaeon]|nr:MAG: methyltransferase [Methanomassiliicoccales archaeon]